MNCKHPWSDADERLIRRAASAGRSASQTARRIGVTKNMVIRRATKLGVQFQSEERGGCNSDQARRGWETRRANGWAPRYRAPVIHIR